MPEISLPDIKLPDIRFRDGKLPDVKLRDIDLRERLPDVDLSKVSLPGPLRDLSLPDVSMPDIHLPEMIRDVRAPKVDLSDVDLRALDPRRIDLSGVDPKRLRAIAPFAKPAPKPASPLPWVVLAGIAGMFAGWWIATSTAGRAMTERVRARIAAWQASRSEWDDAEERSEGFWSNEQGWAHEGATRGSGEAASEVPASEPRWEGMSDAAAIGGTGYDASSGEGRERSETEG